MKIMVQNDPVEWNNGRNWKDHFSSVTLTGNNAVRMCDDGDEEWVEALVSSTDGEQGALPCMAEVDKDGEPDWLLASPSFVGDIKNGLSGTERGEWCTSSLPIQLSCCVSPNRPVSSTVIITHIISATKKQQ